MSQGSRPCASAPVTSASDMPAAASVVLVKDIDHSCVGPVAPSRGRNGRCTGNNGSMSLRKCRVCIGSIAGRYRGGLRIWRLSARAEKRRRARFQARSGRARLRAEEILRLALRPFDMAVGLFEKRLDLLTESGKARVGAFAM